ncbi:hypothetical protein CTAYLR_001372 [Chrysophaeum taylorii]|uniref:Tr-type G domain-containing protein n=1 Tax=Chrysophaeum taylorii TaxID=2483200 RepID=A0AAD7U791_9STRA|nr:hypothetical protein CTAYLR_001372 [Chrysophaeum taylorii]
MMIPRTLAMARGVGRRNAGSALSVVREVGEGGRQGEESVVGGRKEVSSERVSLSRKEWYKVVKSEMEAEGARLAARRARKARSSRMGPLDSVRRKVEARRDAAKALDSNNNNNNDDDDDEAAAAAARDLSSSSSSDEYARRGVWLTEEEVEERSGPLSGVVRRVEARRGAFEQQQQQQQQQERQQAEEEEEEEESKRWKKHQHGSTAHHPPSSKRSAKTTKKKGGTVAELKASGSTVTVGRLGAALGTGSESICATLQALGESVPKIEATKHAIELEVAELVAEALGVSLRIASRGRDEVAATSEVSAAALEAEADAVLEVARPPRPPVDGDAWMLLPHRPPIVGVVGHVDHGKTTLLDALRGASSSEEAGGITQRLAAFEVRGATFVDTPGHAAFRAMRQSTARALDVALVVVAADDGVKPQTLEALSLARDRGAAVVFALTKADKFENRLEAAQLRVRGELAAAGFATEDDGGDAPMVPVSAPLGLGLDELRETLAAHAEVLDLRADPSARAEGVVQDVVFDRHLGTCADAVVTWGTLRTGDRIVVGAASGKIRRLDPPEAGPSRPCRVVARLEGDFAAGDTLLVVPDEKTAKRIAKARLRARNKVVEPASIPSDDKIHVPLVVKVESNGEIDAVEALLASVPTSKVRIEVIGGVGLGTIGRHDVDLAATLGAPIFAWSVGVSGPDVREAARRAKVDLRRHSVIYSLLDDIKAHAASRLPPVSVTKVTGKLEVLRVFPLSSGDRVAGCRVSDGTIHRSDPLRLVRDGDVLHSDLRGAATLKRFKDDVTQVQKGLECGLGPHSPDMAAMLQPGDLIEAFQVVEEPASVDDLE